MERRDELDQQLVEAAAWCEEFNEALVNAREYLEPLQELADDSRYTQWEEWTNSLQHGSELTDQLPELDVPSGEAPLPDDPLFDTGRSRVANLQRIEGRDLDSDD